MDKLASPQRQTWLMLILVGGSLAIALPGHSGTVPTGLSSGVSVGGSNLLPIGASTLCIYQEEVEPPLCREQRLESASANATVDPVTGDITLTIAAQQALNTSASQIAQGLQGTNPVLAILLTTPREISLGNPSPVGASGPGENVAADATIDDLAAAAAAAIANGESVSLTSSQGTLGITAPTATPAGGSDAILSTSAVFTAQGSTPLVAPLRGTRAQIANTAGFLAAAFAAGFTPSQVAPFTEMALAGADYRDLVLLFNAVSGLIPPQPQPRSTTFAVAPSQLEAAIQAYNRIVDNSAPETLVALSENSDFAALGRSLQQLRAAIEVS